MTFACAHWTPIYGTNPPQRLNGETKRGTNVVGIIPDDTSMSSLAGDQAVVA